MTNPGTIGSASTTNPTRRSAVIAALAVAYVLGSGLMWAMVTPRSGAHDEPAHISYATSVARGSLGRLAPVVVRPHAGAVVPGPFIFDDPWSYPWTYRIVVNVPKWAASDNVDVCFAFESSVTADCGTRLFPVTVRQYWTFSQIGLSGASETVETPTTVTTYPPPYYWLVGLPSLALSGATAVYAMRLVGVILAAGLVGAGLAVASPRRRTWLAVGVVFALTPTAAFVTGVINPSGFEVAAALGLMVGLLGLEASHAGRRPLVMVLVLLLAYALAWTRPLSFLTLAAVLAAVTLLNGRELVSWLRDRAVRIVMAAGFGSAFVSAAWFQVFIRSPIAKVVTAGAGEWDVASDVSIRESIGSTLSNLLTWGLDSVGLFGWKDHWSPTSLRLGWLVVLTSMWLLGLVIASGWRRIGLFALGIGAVVVTPMMGLILLFGEVSVGYTVRYHLPVLVLIPVAAVFVIDSQPEGNVSRGSSFRLPRLGVDLTTSASLSPARLLQGLRWVILLAPIVMMVSVAASLYRYSLGGIPSLIDLTELVFGPDKQWLPPVGAIAAVVFGLVLAGVAAVGVFRLARTDPTRVESS